jgi:peptidoglycan/xylan/chitin deacetylase (PgdA/CDA1 family)
LLALALALTLSLTAVPARAADRLLPAVSDAPGQAGTCTDMAGPSIPPPASTETGMAGYHAGWYGQSGYPNLCPGHTAVATVAYMNTGSLGWYASSPRATAYLGTWGPDPGQDKPSRLGGVATGWPAPARVAVQSAPYVGPGQVSWFQFTVQAPETPGVYKLALRPLIEGAQWMEDDGVFWLVTVKASDDPAVSQPSSTPATSTAPVARTYYPLVASDGSKTVRVNALMYHHVEWLPPNADAVRKDLTVTPRDFEDHLKYLKANGYTTITAVDLWWSLDTGQPLPPKPVLLTFDDGYADAHDVVMPLLRAYGMVGTFAVTVNLIDKPDYMTRAQVRDLADGGMDVESHSTDHVAINGLSAAAQTYQLCTSRRILSDWAGRDVRHFIYPSGDYLPVPSAALSGCGYLSAYRKDGGSVETSNEMYALRRARVRGQQGLSALVLALQQ